MARLRAMLPWVAGPVLFLTATLVQGYDLDWDVLNYHFYNGWAASHGAVWRNIQPAMRQSYFAPYMDVVFAWLVLTLPAMGVALVLALAQSLVFPLLVMLTRMMLTPVLPKPGAFWLAMLLAVLGVAAPVNMLEAGGAYGDTASAVVVIASLLVAVWGQARPAGRAQGLAYAGAGLLMGAAVALKLTNAPYAIGLIAILLLDAGRARRRLPGAALAGIVAIPTAFLLIYGAWGAALWVHFQNPVFPSFNNIFRSDFAPPASFTDPAFALPAWRDKLLFMFLRNPAVARGDFAGLFDLRLAITVPLAVAALLVRAFIRPRDALAARQGGMVLMFFLVSALTWEWAFAINRYMVVLEFLAPVVCAVALRDMHAPRAVLWGACLALVPLFVGSALRSPELMWRPGDHRRPTGTGYFGVSATDLADSVPAKTTVAMLGDKPIAFVIPFFPSSARFVRLQGSLFYDSPGFGRLAGGSDAALRRMVFSDATSRAACQAMSQAQGRLAVLRTEATGNQADEAALTYFGLTVQSGACRPIATKAGFGLSLCPATRTASPECGR